MTEFAKWDICNWYLRRRYLSRLLPSPDCSVVVFLKPRTVNGPNHEEVLCALSRFGFRMNKIGEKVFNPIELRLMWRNLRDWNAWLANAKAYASTVCPIYDATHELGNTLQALDFFKRAIRKEFVEADEHVRNVLHAPEDAFESVLHGKVMREMLDLPFLCDRELTDMRHRALQYVRAHRKSADFYLVNCLLEDESQRRLANGLFGLCGISLAEDGSIAQVECLTDHAWKLVQREELWEEIVVFRLLYNSTFIHGVATKFLTCLAFYERLFHNYCYAHSLVQPEEGESQVQRVNRFLAGPEEELYLHAFLPPAHFPSKISAIELSAARDWQRMQKETHAH